MTNTPSDAEIVALAISEGIKVRTGAGAVRLIRAVLAKWGTPQPVTLGFTIENRAGIDVLVWKDGGVPTSNKRRGCYVEIARSSTTTSCAGAADM